MLKRVGNYVLTEELGRGQFGIVYKGHLADDPTKFYAIKTLLKKRLQENPTLERLFHTEVAVMQKIDHTNVMHLYNFLETPNNYYMVMRYCSEGDFEHFMKKRGIKFFPEEEVIYFLKQIMNGFQELHRCKVMHRYILTQI